MFNPLYLQALPALLWLFILAAAGWFWLRGRPSQAESSDAGLSGTVILLAMLVYMFSDLSDSVWFYFIGWPPEERGWAVMTESIGGRMCLITLLLTPLLVWRQRLAMWFLTGFVVFFPLRCVYEFFKIAGRAVLSGDDHPSFLFRLFVYQQIAPHNVFYNPYWNGGKVESALAASGANMVGNFALPFQRFFETHEIYNGLVLGLFIFLIPAACGLAVHLAGGSRRAVLMGVLLGLLPSRIASKWFIHFGTVGAGLAMPMLALTAAALFAVVYQGRRERWVYAVLAVSSVIFLSWPVGVVMAVPMVLVLLPGLIRMDKAGWVRLGVTGAIIAVLAAPQFYTILVHADLSGFSAVGSKTINWSREWVKGWGNLQAFAVETHPLALFAGGVGVWCLPDKRFRWMWGGMMGLMLVLAGWGEMWKPQFQLTRTAVPLAYLALVPAALMMDRWMSGDSFGTRVKTAAIIALLFYTGVNASKVYSNDRLTGAMYRLSPDYMTELVDLIASEAEVDGRILFTGATVHRYGGGHIAYLPALTGRQMMGCDYYHFSPKLVEYNYPPAEFRRRDGGMEEFIDLYNVSHVLVHLKNWHRWAQEHPELLTRVGGIEPERPIDLYRVNQRPGWFIKGRGSVTADAKALKVDIEGLPDEVVIKYHYDKRLRASSPAELFDYRFSDKVHFIGIRPNGASSVTIRLK